MPMNDVHEYQGYQIKTIEVGSYGVNNYLIYHPGTGHAVLIDAGDDLRGILSFIEKKRLKLTHIINTHGHLDHIFGNAELKQRYGALICIHEDEKDALTDPKKNLSLFMGLEVTSPPADILLQDGQKLEVEGLTFNVIHCPGHSPGGIALLLGYYLFCGDILFAGSVGRTDFPGGSMEMLIQGIREKLLVLPDETIVFPGHGPSTTIGYEKTWNPYL